MIDLLANEDQQALVDSFQDLLRDESPIGSGSPADLWEHLVPLGWLGLSRSEADGGAGLGPVEIMLIMREAGRFLVTPSLLATIAAINILDAHGDRELASGLAAGTERAALALLRGDGSAYLVDAEEASIALLVGENSVAIHRITGDRTPLVSVDQRVSLAAASLSEPLTASGDVLTVRLMISAQLVGAAQAVRDMAVQYAGVREQFGQPIGGFQAIKHACADLAIRAEAADAQASYAALALAGNLPEAAAEVAAAMRIAVQAATHNAEANIQIHGAMGSTDECYAHLFLKRTNLLALIDGRSNWQMEALLAA